MPRLKAKLNQLLPVSVSVRVSMCLCVYLCVCVCIYVSVHVSMCLCVYLDHFLAISPDTALSLMTSLTTTFPPVV